MLNVDQRELIRRMVLIEGLSQREVARRLGHSRNSVADALRAAEATQYMLSKPKKRPKLEPVIPIIQQWLKDDKSRHRKQRHSATRIHERLCQEYGFTGSLRAVSGVVKQLRQELVPQEVFVPIEHPPGSEIQIDWGEAQIVLNGQEVTIMLFCARLPYSKASFVRAYERQDQVSFMDAHVHLMNFLGGVPKTCAYDNLTSAVTKVIGRERQLNKKFVEMRSHYLFQTRFCNVAKGNEKGHTENSVKRAQSNYLTPPPSVTSLEQLNRLLVERCRADLSRVDKESQLNYGELFEQELRMFLPLPPLPFKATVQRAVRIDRFSTVQSDGARYSVPVKYACLHAVVRVGVETVEVLLGNEIVARHKRSVAGRWVLELEHYLPLLQKKPGLIDSGKPFTKANFTEAELLLRKELEYRYQDEGTRQFLRILMLSHEYEFPIVREAIRRCVKARLFHEEAIRLELTRLTETRAKRDFNELDLANRPDLQIGVTGTRDLSVYDELSKMVGSDTRSFFQVSTLTQGSAIENVCDQEQSIRREDDAEAAASEVRDRASESRNGSETAKVTNILGGVCSIICGMFA